MPGCPGKSNPTDTLYIRPLFIFDNCTTDRPRAIISPVISNHWPILTKVAPFFFPGLFSCASKEVRDFQKASYFKPIPNFIAALTRDPHPIILCLHTTPGPLDFTLLIGGLTAAPRFLNYYYPFSFLSLLLLLPLPPYSHAHTLPPTCTCIFTLTLALNLPHIRTSAHIHPSTHHLSRPTRCNNRVVSPHPLDETTLDARCPYPSCRFLAGSPFASANGRPPNLECPHLSIWLCCRAVGARYWKREEKR